MNINKNQENDILTIGIDGWLDMESAPKLSEEVEIINDDINKIILDCTNLEYVSSAGLRVIVSMHKKMKDKNGLILKGVTDDVMEILEMSGFSNHLTFEK